MRRLLPLLFLAACLPALAADKPDEAAFAVSPAPEPVPRLSVMFRPSLAEMQAGNPAHIYLKCFMEQNYLFARKESDEEQERLLAAPLTEMRGVDRKFGGAATRNARHAARLDTVDWGITEEMKAEGYYTLLPDIQKLRQLARVVKIRARAGLAHGDYAESAKDVSVLFSMARHLGEHPCFIGTLVGIAIGGQGADVAAEWVRQPGSPNLYWALATLPDPLVPQDKAFVGEAGMYPAGLQGLVGDKAPWTPKQEADAEEFARLVAGFSEMPVKSRDRVVELMKRWAADPAWLAAAQARLAAAGRLDPAPAKYPPKQVVFLDVYARAEAEHQEYLALCQFPYHQVIGLMVERERRRNSDDPEVALLQVLTSAVSKARGAQARLGQRLALLRGVEAVRLALATSGKLPATWADTNVPAPIDPVTGKELVLKLEGDTVTLAGAVPPGYAAEQWAAGKAGVYRVTKR